MPNSSKSPATFPALFPHLAVVPWMRRESQGLILFNPGLQPCVLKCFSWLLCASVSPSGKQRGVIMLASFDLYSCIFLYSMGARALVSSFSLAGDQGTWKVEDELCLLHPSGSWLCAQAVGLLAQQSVSGQIGCSWEARGGGEAARVGMHHEVRAGG